MRKLIIALMVACSLIIYTGCANNNAQTISESDIGTSDEDAAAFDHNLETHESSIISVLESDIPSPFVTISYKDDRYNISVILKNPDDIAFFGNYIIATIDAFESEFITTDRGNIAVNLICDKWAVSYFRYCDEDGFGVVFDDRSGSLETTYLKNVDDLFDIFPSAADYESKSDLYKNDVEIYDEVWSVLQEQYDRPETEIYEELAPRYGMTADELSDFMLDMLKKIN